jgi:hypothetical protein
MELSLPQLAHADIFYLTQNSEHFQKQYWYMGSDSFLHPPRENFTGFFHLHERRGLKRYPHAFSLSR